METLKKRNSRFDDNKPVIRNGEIVVARPTKRMKTKVFSILDTALQRQPWSYDYLPTDYLAALPQTPWSKLYLGDRLPLFCRPPNQYLRRPTSQKANFVALGRCSVFAHPTTHIRPTLFWHDLMTNMIMAQVEIGASAGRP